MKPRLIHRRSFLLGLGAAVAAPAIIRPGVLMPIKRMVDDGMALRFIEHPSVVPRAALAADLTEESLVNLIVEIKRALVPRLYVRGLRVLPRP